MKAMSLIRRIDNLGRIVIPKETRRSLRIKSGEPLEIYLDGETIILKKISSLNGLEKLAQNYVDVIYATNKHDVLITDRDSIIAVGGPQKKKYYKKLISKYIDNIISGRKNIFQKERNSLEIVPNEKENVSYAIGTIIVNGDAIGSIIILSFIDELDEFDEKLVNLIANFIGKSIEE